MIKTAFLLSLFLGVPLVAAPQDPVRASPADPAPILASSAEHGLPGAAQGSERWIAHFQTRTFDLQALRTAIRAHRPADEVAAIVHDLEAAVTRDQQPFVAAVEALGGRVDQQWWLINAAVAEIDPAQLSALRALPNVAYVEADQAREPVILTATNANNHNADAVQAQGHKGLGAAVGIVDTGHDENMGGTGRPHRTYYVNGDPLNLTGGGIGGSRLLVNRQIGTQPADDVNGHGTGVDSIAAGANWGIAGADDGHAPLAGIAGYAISNNTAGSSSDAVMASAWQSLTADAPTFNIVSANMSYSASNDPLSASSQAMDGAALVGDVLYCVAAGNSGTTQFSPPAVNGLAVAALIPNTHVIASFSSRGPMQSDPQRTYPDIAGCGVGTVMAARNNEGGTFVADGTSMASPQVAGAAVQLRARFPALSALETKAVLLASTLDLSTQNPGLDRNAFGLGLLRNDRAHDLAAAGHVGSGQTNAGAPHTFTIPVQAGRTYRAVITWHRQNVNSTSWSDLDLEALDPSSTVLASSTSPRNLYEFVTIFAPFTGNATIRTTGVSFEQGTTENFAFAWTETPGVPLRGEIASFGNGCAPVCDGQNQSGGTLANTLLPATAEFAYDMSTTGPMTLTGLEMFTASTGANVGLVAVIYPQVAGTIGTTRLGLTSIPIGPTPQFYRGNFSTPINLPGGAFWIAIYHQGNSYLSDLTAGTTGGAFTRPTLLTGAWTRSPLTVRPAFRLSCNSLPGAGGQPLLTGAPALRIGAGTTLSADRLAANTVAFFGLGTSNTTSLLGPLPVALDPFGAIGCQLLISTDVDLSLVLADPSGLATRSLAVPNDPIFTGLRLYSQCFAAAPGANPMGLTVSNAVSLLVGNI